MDKYLEPAIIVAIAGVIMQGISATVNVIDKIISRKQVSRQNNISMFVALTHLIDSTNLSYGNKTVLKKNLVNDLLENTISEEIINAFKQDV